MTDTKKVAGTMLVAAALWFVMFSPWTAPHVNFWVVMTLSATVLTTLSLLLRPQVLRELKPSLTDIVLGVAVAAALWGVFWIGDKLATLMFNFARPQVDSIYGIKEGVSPLLLSLLLLFWIGPAEEIFWRGYAQHTLCKGLGLNLGAVVTTLVYALVHASSLNFMLVMASLVAGVVWGVMYRLFPARFPAVVISHALWDAAVFVWFPI